MEGIAMQVNEMENEDGSLTREEEKALLQYALKKVIMEAVEDE